MSGIRVLYKVFQKKNNKVFQKAKSLRQEINKGVLSNKNTSAPPSFLRQEHTNFFSTIFQLTLDSHSLVRGTI